MKLEQMQKFFDDAKSNSIAFEGNCHECKTKTAVNCDIEQNGKLVVKGGAVYLAGNPQTIYIKCDKCFKDNPELRNFQHCDIYSRCVGYYRPVNQWNEGKQSEFKDRQEYSIEKILESGL